MCAEALSSLKYWPIPVPLFVINFPSIVAFSH